MLFTLRESRRTPDPALPRVRKRKEKCKWKYTSDNGMDLKIDPFQLTLSRHGLKLKRKKTQTLQINIGLLCNQNCQHCHLNAGPGKKENMNSDTLNEMVAYAIRSKFEVIDITGGAPELNPIIDEIVARLSPLAPRIMLRPNLSALNDGKAQDNRHFNMI